ncbi:MAG: MarR family transcriptional regulator [Bacteroidota bacterium]
MGIAEEIKQKDFKSEFSKAVVNVIYTNAWLAQKHWDLFKEYDLTRPQFNILRILRGQYPKPATVNLLIDRMLDKSSNASRIIDKLEQKNLVLRKQCPDDRRAVDVIISDQGLKLLAALDTDMKSWEDSVNKLSDEECRTLNTLLDKMRKTDESVA